ncbi:hypothetical protein V8C35DRAFT_318731 [Trichoderma chlorosporum]
MAFINFSDSSTRISAAVSYQARSHAAREGHAKTRRRMLEYFAANDNRIASTNGISQNSTFRTRDLFNSTSISQFSHSHLEPPAIIPSPTALLASGRRDPFDSSSWLLTEAEQFMFDHYVTVVIPFMNTRCAILADPRDYQSQLRRDWVGLALADVGLLNGIFLATCRHLEACYKSNQYARLATQYKMACLRALREAVSHDAAQDGAIASAMSLAFDEI